MMLMILVLWILRKSLNRLSHYHLQVQLDLKTSGVSSLIQHSSDYRDPSMMQNVLSHPYFLLHRSLQISFWLSPDSAPKFSQVFVNGFLRCRHLHCLRRGNKFVYQIIMMQWITHSLFLPYGLREFLVQFLPYAVSWIPLLPGYTHFWTCDHRSCYGLLRASYLSFYKAGTSNFYRAFLMISLNSVSSGSMKQIPLSLLAFSSFGFSLAQFCFPSFSTSLKYFSRYLATNDQALMLLAVSFNSLQTTYIRLDAFFFH